MGGVISYIKKTYFRYVLIGGTGLLNPTERLVYHIFVAIGLYFITGYVMSFLMLMKNYLLT
jgi:hypothetical protein